MNRHFKKYYFYILGRYFDYLHKFDASIDAYSKAMRFRFFFADIQTRFANAYNKRTKKSSIIIRGGVGDFLQCVPFILRNKSATYLVRSHFYKSKEFFDSLNINVTQFFIFSDLKEEKLVDQSIEKYGLIYQSPRDLFFQSSPFKSNEIRWNNRFPTVGIHMAGSSFAVNLEISQGLIPKSLPKSFVHKLLMHLSHMDINILFFGTKEEIKLLELNEHEKLQFVCDDDIVLNLSHVAQCDAFIGSDSAFKTMSSMLKIPTLVICPDRKDNYRDRMFLNPYVKEKVMSVIKYKTLSTRETDKIILNIQKSLIDLVF